MDENTSLRKLNSETELLEKIVREGFSNGTYGEFLRCFEREPTKKELSSPAYLLAQAGASSGLYCMMGENLSQDAEYYAKRCPQWLQFLSARQELTLDKAVGRSINNLNISLEYMPGLKMETNSPKMYNRLESVVRKRLPEEKQGQKMYVASLDISQMDYGSAVGLFREIYDLVPEKSLEVHNNNQSIHKQVDDLDAALSEVLNGSIVKADQPVSSPYSPKVNVYLKPNSSYHVRVDILGTEQEIVDFTKQVEAKLTAIYTQQKQAHLDN